MNLVSPVMKHATRTPIDVIPVEWLVEQYARMGVDISRLIPLGVNVVTAYKDTTTDLLYFDPPIVGDGPFYEQLEKQPWYYAGDKNEYYSAARLTAGRKILDVGCGLGRFAPHAAAHEFVGLELSDSLAGLARQSGLDVRAESVGEHALHRGGYYDVVTAFQVLEHVPQPEQFLVELARCAKNGGRIFVSVPSDDGFVGTAEDHALNMPPHHQTRWSDLALERIAARAKLSVVAIMHEKIDKMHVDWALQVFWASLFREPTLRARRARSRSIWESLFRKCVRRVAPHRREAVARLLNGHTVSVILEKPN
jgi:2-polyprenyl-3-methyl-5-hydroxy-6-metoxy-1,4-benzoquinol methylase